MLPWQAVAGSKVSVVVNKDGMACFSQAIRDFANMFFEKRKLGHVSESIAFVEVEKTETHANEHDDDGSMLLFR